jgi:hypothetical protein
MKREPVGKRLRFQIFDRDGFACQYCGKTPPDVKLEIDHIISVSTGGTNDPENLRTSCSACNAGKSNRQLGAVSNDKDSLRRSQEALESVDTAKQFSKAMKAREAVRRDIVDFICSCLGAKECKNNTVSSLLFAVENHGSEQVMRWFERAASVTAHYGRPNETDVIKYFHGIIRRVTEQAGEQ